ncbi:hypothetical protein [Moorena sp. SIO3I6]|uniref:hypothetical protein n=1 Tax=Moorena sp. SIO3I6 TaxID=2607831 RepID=UPI0013F9AE54|nr:hypothetical protein [Moorena sp. SIO3I6]NEP21202.1 hypothetical protein [Moorena sp. SIO3I6]
MTLISYLDTADRYSLFPVPCSLKSIKFYLIAMIIAIGLHLKYKPYISLQGAW